MKIGMYFDPYATSMKTVEDEFSFLADAHNVMFRSDDFTEKLETYFKEPNWDKNI